MEKKLFKIELGVTAKDIITGFEGVVSGRTDYQTGCQTYGLISKTLDKDGKPKAWQWFDEGRLEVVDDKVVDLNKKANPGGPCNPDAPSQ